MALAVAWFGWTSTTSAQAPPVHYHHAGAMPPGAIGSQHLLRGGPLPGYFQPVELKLPEGATISPAVDGVFEEPVLGPLKIGMLIGAVYRLRVTNIPLHEGVEVYPSVEVIDRLYPPRRTEHKFPIPIDITQEDLELAASGRFVTRVIYLEDPEAALPVAEDPAQQTYFEVRRGENPLDVADRLGRPMAILRIGGRVPDASGLDAAFLYGSPPLLKFLPAGEQVMGDPRFSEPCEIVPTSHSAAVNTPSTKRRVPIIRGQQASSSNSLGATGYASAQQRSANVTASKSPSKKSFWRGLR
jgi:hypothetical protein